MGREQGYKTTIRRLLRAHEAARDIRARKAMKAIETAICVTEHEATSPPPHPAFQTPEPAEQQHLRPPL